MPEKKPYHERVAEEIMHALKAGTAPWVKPWKAGERPERPMNALTGKPYKGWNSVYLAMKQPGQDSRWCTYKQAKELGAQVRKGEKGTVLQYWKISDRRLLKDDSDQPILDKNGEKQYKNVQLERPSVFHVVVFNADQIDGLTPLPPRQDMPAWERHTKAEVLLKNSNASIVHDQNDRALYRSSTDQIHLPPKGQFENSDQYYATALHELGHWTGHDSRLDRDLANPFGSVGYAKEELRAEMASFMLGTELGIGHDPSQHVSYIGSWIKVLQDDPLELFRASRDAQQIMEYVQGFEQSQEHVKSEAAVLEVNKIEITTTHQQTPDIAQEKTWLKVPFAEKNDAKKYGAKWDKNVKSWYADVGTDLTPLKPWMTDNIYPQVPIEDPQIEFANALKAHGLEIEGQPIMDGRLYRVPVEGDEKGQKSGAYTGYLDDHPAGFIQNFKTGLKTNWKAIGQSINASEIARLEKRAKMKKQARAQEKLELYEATAQAVSTEWASLPAVPTVHGYLKTKLLHTSGTGFGAKLDAQGQLVVPMRDTSGKLWSVQRISIYGQKGFEKNGKALGCFHTIGGLDVLRRQSSSEPVLLSTGFATAATVHLASKKPVVVAFQDGNLLAVAQELQKLFPKREIVIFGDDDRHLPDQKPPRSNSGRVKATEAAQAVGGRAVFPQFLSSERGRAFTDFADLCKARGIHEVARQIKMHHQKTKVVQQVSRVQTKKSHGMTI